MNKEEILAKAQKENKTEPMSAGAVWLTGGSFVCPVLVFPYSILVIALKSGYSVPSSHTLASG